METKYYNEVLNYLRDRVDCLNKRDVHAIDVDININFDPLIVKVEYYYGWRILEVWRCDEDGQMHEETNNFPRKITQE